MDLNRYRAAGAGSFQRYKTTNSATIPKRLNHSVSSLATYKDAICHSQRTITEPSIT